MAGLYGAATVSTSILFVQTVPAVLALVSLYVLKADTEGYYNLLGNKLLPYQVLPYRIISSISIPLWLVGILVTLRFAIGKVADLIYKFKKYMKTRFNK